MVKPATVPEGTDANHPPEQAKPKATLKDCLCGCGTKTKARFAVGHDARLKSRLINQVLDGSTIEAQGDGSAETKLRELGWTHHLDASRKSRQGKADAKTKREEEKAAKAAAKAAEPNANENLENHVSERKAAKAHEGQFRAIAGELDGAEQVVKVIKVARRDKNDVNSPFVAKVEWFDDPEASSGRHELEVEVSELRELSAEDSSAAS